MSTYGKMDNLTLSYDGNRLTGVTEASADYDFAGSFEYKRVNGSQYLYNANGSLIADKSRGIAYITYDSNNTPSRIYFTNGNITKYVYSATGQKLRVEYYVAVPNTTVTFGAEPDALTQSQTTYAGSRQYLLGGSLVMEDGMVDRFLFDGGYAKASAVNPTTYNFSFNYYNQDHLGNNREVVDSAGTVRQITHYYPFGTPYADPSTILNASLQPYKYNFSIERGKRKPACSSEREKNRPEVNGKELDRMHGLNTYDYGARQYAPILGRWDRMDPLCEKYYDVSPYMYCMDNPIKYIDPDGLSTWVTDEGDGKYKVIGGDLCDNDLNIYVYSLDKKGEYTIRGKSIGETPLHSSFYNSDKGSWEIGSVIYINDMSGINFIQKVKGNNVPLFTYIANAFNDHKFDFKATNGTNEKIYSEVKDYYRGMPIKLENGKTVITSARDIGNMMAGYKAGISGLDWSDVEKAFDLYQ